LVGTSSGAVLFYDDFSGLAATTLHGTTPDTTQSSITWTADSDFKANGSVANGTAGVAFLNIGTLINGNRGNADAIYTLETRFDVGNSSATDWFGVGFVMSPDAGNLGTIFSNAGNAGMSWLLHRENGSISTFTSTASNAVVNATLGQVILDVRMIYDLTDWNGSSNYGSMTIEAKSSLSSTYTALRTITLTSTTSNLQAFGYSNNQAPATIDYVQLSQTPEPSSALLGGLGFLLLLRRRR
jgi:hypothetical protein